MLNFFHLSVFFHPSASAALHFYKSVMAWWILFFFFFADARTTPCRLAVFASRRFVLRFLLRKFRPPYTRRADSEIAAPARLLAHKEKKKKKEKWKKKVWEEDRKIVGRLWSYTERGGRGEKKSTLRRGTIHMLSCAHVCSSYIVRDVALFRSDGIIWLGECHAYWVSALTGSNHHRPLSTYISVDVQMSSLPSHLNRKEHGHPAVAVFLWNCSELKLIVPCGQRHWSKRVTSKLPVLVLFTAEVSTVWLWTQGKVLGGQHIFLSKSYSEN